MKNPIGLGGILTKNLNSDARDSRPLATELPRILRVYVRRMEIDGNLKAAFEWKNPEQKQYMSDKGGWPGRVPKQEHSIQVAPDSQRLLRLCYHAL